ncbi:MAG: phosphatase PAP2 family protein [candidate division Zixibacteria bacterium]|nr:phosphatase PAP2 family protein [candidate division Zixibacteria bacterium]NIR67993.1 phosphatase PAP2 family protein [candidate division Zixibacteria bacterium]NIS17493.1 phosphatase PAP2 family protein [candidate division Zixibacteria bacterium]NIS49199.1 phosphatase PAP2 family protein [candidate division Zixibacteria bacterium]NIT53802.1 phosphatase PAP2 family protein [candidate division Zixibacteria bacterium]
MLEFIVNLDNQLMYFLNVRLANPVFDFAMPIITHEWFVRIFFLSFALAAAIFGGKYGRITALLLVLTVILTDQASSGIIKPLVGRMRPCKMLEGLHVLIDCSSGKSFPSGHATNSFGQAAIWVWRYPKYKWFFIISASVIALSRIFVGVHYPFDVLVGAILGTICGLIVFLIWTFAKRIKVANKALDKRT